LTYEDLVFNQEATLKGLFAFLLEVESVEGTLIAGLLEEYAAKGFSQSKNQAYKLKATTGKVCARKDMYTQE